MNKRDSVKLGTALTSKKAIEERETVANCMRRLVSSRARSAGRRAKKSGDGIKSNPHLFGSDDHWEWAAGYWGY